MLPLAAMTRWTLKIARVIYVMYVENDELKQSVFFFICGHDLCITSIRWILPMFLNSVRGKQIGFLVVYIFVITSIKFTLLKLYNDATLP